MGKTRLLVFNLENYQTNIRNDLTSNFQILLEDTERNIGIVWVKVIIETDEDHTALVLKYSCRGLLDCID